MRVATRALLIACTASVTDCADAEARIPDPPAAAKMIAAALKSLPAVRPVIRQSPQKATGASIARAPNIQVYRQSPPRAMPASVSVPWRRKAPPTPESLLPPAPDTTTFETEAALRPSAAAAGSTPHPGR